MSSSNLLFLCVASVGCAASLPLPAASSPEASGPSAFAPRAATAPADAACAAVQTPNQRHDEDTLRRIEHDWLAAELRGDARYLECMLLPDYVNIRKDGTKQLGSELLARVRKNAGKQPEIPEMRSTVVVHGDVALVQRTKCGQRSAPTFRRSIES